MVRYEKKFGASSEAAKIKKDFINTLEWRRWRYTMVDWYENKDVITQKKLRKGFNVHHLDMREENYTILRPERFRPLNKDSHECVHFIFRYYEKDPEIIDRLKAVLDKMVEYNHDGGNE